MKDPEEALAAARAAAAARREPGAATEDWQFDSSVDRSRRLTRWAIIQPELIEVSSTRRFGRPITWLKRMLIRLLSQYLNQMTAQQSRFNADAAGHIIALEKRVRELEDELARRHS
jgi:hypothetical protein